MCSRCGEPMFSKEVDRVVGKILYWLTSPIWMPLWFILWLVSIPIRAIICGIQYALGDLSDDAV